jgi:hypothetical protein
MAESETLRNKIEIMKSSSANRPGVAQQFGDHDPEYIQLKYEDWKKKMLCLVCKQRENDIML